MSEGATGLWSLATRTGGELGKVRDVERVEPRASAMLEAMRAVGYTLQTAVADLVDNSITAGARNIWIELTWNGIDSWLTLLDDGRGMAEHELTEAMRPGSRSPIEDRDPGDLGRFGLGLKTASFSQCRRLTVATRQGDGPVKSRCWDLDYVALTGEWLLQKSASKDSARRIKPLAELGGGTIVLWESLDRIVGDAPVTDEDAQKRFYELLDRLKAHLGMVFHRFLEKKSRLQIQLNGHAVEPWDPFFRKHKATQQLPETTLPFKRGRVVVQPYVLPHHSKMTEKEHSASAGPSGWNAQQGFYVYRNERLLVAGDWLGLSFQKEEHFKLARIQVDLPNSMDAAWELDVKKSRARPPGVLRDRLKHLAKLTRDESAAIYRNRGKVIARTASLEQVFLWHKKVKHNKIFYEINREHPLVAQLLDSTPEVKDAARSLLRLIEETIPVPLILVDGAESPDKHGVPFEHARSKEVMGVIESIFTALQASGYTKAEARRRISGMEPFQGYAELIATL